MAPFHANLGTSLRSLGRLAEAEASYRRAIDVKPDYSDAHNHLGTTLLDLGRKDEAEACYREALRLRPDYGDAHNNFGNLLRETKRLTEAEEHYRQALRLIPPSQPKVTLTLRNLAGVLNDQERHNEAEAACRAALEREPAASEAHELHAATLRELNQFDVAEPAVLRAIALAPDSASAYVEQARLLQAMGRVVQAEHPCHRALVIAPGDIEAVACLGGIAFDLGRWDEAGAMRLSVLRRDPDNIHRHSGYALAHKYREGDPHLAEMERLAARQEEHSDKDLGVLHFALAKAYGDLGLKDRAFEHQLLANTAHRRTFDYDEAETIGQIEKIKSIFTRSFISAHRRGYKEASGPIFILGMMRSGSTLAEQVLASHPQVYGAGELALFRQTLVRQSGVASKYPDQVPSLSGSEIDALGRDYEARLRREAPGFARITDKFLHNFLYCGLIALSMPHARIIHTVRDPIDTCLSIYSMKFAGHHPYAYDLAELGRYYRAYRSLMDHWREVLPEGAMIDLRYADMVDDLEGQARRLLDHCDLPWDDAVLSFHKTDRAVRTASATQVRQPIYKSSVGRWKPSPELLRPLTDALGEP